jgi:hypothetical protein
MNQYPSQTIGGHVVHYVGKVCNHAIDHVVPRAQNDQYPHALRHRVLFGYSAILILVKALAIAIPIALPAASLYSSAITSTNVLTLTNAARSTAGLGAVGMNGLLTQAAQAKAADMLAGQYFAHQSPDGRMPWNFIRATGYSYRHAGENLAVHFQQAEDVHAGWMASPTHRANILDNRYTDIGIGVSSGEFEGVPAIFVVQMFGTPQTPPEAPVVVAQPAVQPVPEPEPTPEPVPTQPAEPTFVPAPIPEPTPEPVAAPAEAEPQPLAAPAIHAASASITPIPTGYRVTVDVENALAVNMSIGASTAPLDRDPAGTDAWYGVIATPAAAGGRNGALTAIAAGEGGQVTSTVLAVLTPAQVPQDLYLFNQDERVVPKVFGIVDLGDFDDTSKRLYAYASIFMAALLLVAIAFRFHKHHPTVLAHGTGVLALTILLGMI